MSPNATKNYNGSPEYFSGLVDKTGLSQREVARRLGVGYSSLRAYIDGTRAVIYPVQFALEALVESIDKSFYRVEFNLDTGSVNWREAQDAAARFEAKQAGAGRASGTFEDVEYYKEEFERWLEEYEGLGKEALSVVVVKIEDEE